MNHLLEKYREEIDRVLAKYPSDQKRAAVMPLLFIAQREGGYVSERDLDEIAEILEMSETDVASLVGFYTLYHDKPEGKFRIQVCNDLPCALRGADDYLAELCQRLNVSVGGTTEDGQVTVEAVMCLAACHRAPMFQLQSYTGISYHENQSVESTLAFIEQLRNGRNGS